MSDEILGNEVEATQTEAEIAPVEQPEVETSEAPVEAATQSEQSQDDPIKAAQERAGRAIAAQRKLMNEQVEKLRRENELLKRGQQQQQADGAQYDPNRMVYDPKTERYYSFDDPNPAAQAIAAQVWREQEAEKRYKVQKDQQIFDETANKIMAGQAIYDNFDDAVTTFQALGNNDIAFALTAADDPAKLVHYLGNNTKELSRLSNLSPAQVQREIVKLEIALQDQRKLVSKAKSPIDHLNEPKNKVNPPEAQSYEERAAYWHKTLNSHGET